MQIERILSEPMLAVLPSTHHLASREAIELEELREKPFILYPRNLGTGIFDAGMQACETAGFLPTAGMEVPQTTSVVTFVAAGMGVSVLPKTMSQLQTEGVQYVPLSGTPHPISTYESPLKLVNPVGNHLPATYIAVTPHFAVLNSSRMYAKSREDWAYLEIPAGHDAMVTSPRLLFEILAEI